MNMNPLDNTKTINTIVPVVATADVLSAAAIDVTGFKYAQVLCLQGDMGASATMLWKVTECATSGGTYTDVTGAAFTAAGVDSAIKEFEIDLRGRQQFMKISGTYGGSGNAPVACVVVLHSPDNMSRATGAAAATVKRA